VSGQKTLDPKNLTFVCVFKLDSPEADARYLSPQDRVTVQNVDVSHNTHWSLESSTACKVCHRILKKKMVFTGVAVLLRNSWLAPMVGAACSGQSLFGCYSIGYRHRLTSIVN
jgi:hypothetical protein